MDRKPTFVELEYIQNEVKQKGKSTKLTYILVVLLGFFGAHLGYLEKTKSAISRFLLTIVTLILFYLLGTTVQLFDSNSLTSHVELYGSMLFTILIIAIVAQLVWLMFDLVAIPREISNVNKKIEEKAHNEIIQSRYAAEAIRKEEISEIIVDKVIENINPEINERVKSEVEKTVNKVNSLSNVIKDRDMEIKKVENEVKDKMNYTIKLQDKLNNKINEIQKVILRDVGSIYKQINEHDYKVPKSLEMRRSGNDVMNDNNTHDNNNNDDTTQYSEEISLKSMLSDSRKSNHSLNKKDKSQSTKHDVSNKNLHDSKLKDISRLSLERLKDKNTIDNHKVTEIDYDKVNFNDNIESNSKSILNAINQKEGKVSTEGFIVGQMDNGSKKTNSYTSDSNLLIADNKNETDIDNMLVIQITKKSGLRGDLGLRSNPGNLGKKVKLTGERDTYFKHYGVKDIEVLEIVG